MLVVILNGWMVIHDSSPPSSLTLSSLRNWREREGREEGAREREDTERER